PAADELVRPGARPGGGAGRLDRRHPPFARQRDAQAPARGGRGARSEGAREDSLSARLPDLPGHVRDLAGACGVRLPRRVQVSRVLVGALFLAATVATAMSTFDRLQTAFDLGTTRAWAVVGYWALKTAVIAAFTFFIAVRPESRRPSRDPVAFIACA